MATNTDPVDIAIGLAAVGVRAGAVAGQTAVDTGRIVGRISLAFPPVAFVASRTASEGRRARSSAGDVTDEVVRRLAESGVIERVVTQVAASLDVERLIAGALEHPATQKAVEAVLTSPAFEKLLFEILDSQLLLEATDRVLHSPEMQRAIERIASSPELRRAMAEQSSGIAKELVGGVRKSSATFDDVAEEKVRGWLRRQRPQTS